MTLKEIIQKYPVKNNLWHFHDTSFSAWASDSRDRVMLDPWNRSLPHGAQMYRDDEGDVTHWDYITSVEGWAVKLTVFND